MQAAHGFLSGIIRHALFYIYLVFSHIYFLLLASMLYRCFDMVKF